MYTGNCPNVVRSAVQPKTTRLCGSLSVITLCTVTNLDKCQVKSGKRERVFPKKELAVAGAVEDATIDIT